MTPNRAFICDAVNHFTLIWPSQLTEHSVSCYYLLCDPQQGNHLWCSKSFHPNMTFTVDWAFCIMLLPTLWPPTGQGRTHHHLWPWWWHRRQQLDRHQECRVAMGTGHLGNPPDAGDEQPALSHRPAGWRADPMWYVSGGFSGVVFL